MFKLLLYYNNNKCLNIYYIKPRKKMYKIDRTSYTNKKKSVHLINAPPKQRILIN